MQYMNLTNIREVDMRHNYAAYLNTDIGEVDMLHNYAVYDLTDIGEVDTNYAAY